MEAQGGALVDPAYVEEAWGEVDLDSLEAVVLDSSEGVDLDS